MDEPCDRCGKWDDSESERVDEKELVKYRQMVLACNQHRCYEWAEWEGVAARLLEHIDALEAEIRALRSCKAAEAYGDAYGNEIKVGAIVEVELEPYGRPRMRVLELRSFRGGDEALCEELDVPTEYDPDETVAFDDPVSGEKFTLTLGDLYEPAWWPCEELYLSGE